MSSNESSTLPATSSATSPPLVVDLDGTLIYSDLLWEAMLLFMKQHFWKIWRLPFWLLRGKSGFKQQLALHIAFDPATLPYDQGLLATLAEQRQTGRRLVLATGSQRRFAEQIASHTGLFDDVMATDDEGVNLTSHNKADALTARYGPRGFDYIGNSPVDVPVWQASRQAYSVTMKPFALGGGTATTHMGTPRKPVMRALLKAMRPRQWLKNLLVFLPMLAGHALDLPTFLQSLLAFVAFSLCASSAYLLNDALDAHDDRLHPTKCKRPIAAGTLPLALAMISSPLLALAAILLCATFNPLLLAVVLVYFVATLSYSFVLKRLLMIDIVTLALLYTVRILGGAAATQIEPSFWLLAFSFFLFLSLALLKRYSELFNLKRQGKDKTSGRGYSVADKPAIGAMGINSGMLSVLIFMLYINSPNVQKLYPSQHWLLAVVPLLVYWLGRLWTLGFRGQVNEDPVLYVSKDAVSLVVIGLCILFVAGAAF